MIRGVTSSGELQIGNSGLFEFTKDIILTEILKISPDGNTLSIFTREGDCLLYDISIEAIKKLESFFFKLYIESVLNSNAEINEDWYFLKIPKKTFNTFTQKY